MDIVTIDKRTNETLEFIINIADLSTDTKTMSREDIIGIAVELYRLACMSENMTKPAVFVWRQARMNYELNKES